MNPTLFDASGRKVEATNFSELQSTITYQNENITFMKERLAELELAMEDQGWRQLMVGGHRDFSRAALAQIQHLSRMMYLKNPLIKRGVNVTAQYVWGRGVNITARAPEVNVVVQSFLDDPKNKAELTSHQARMLKEVDLQVLGNIFFVFFSDVSTGAVTVRTIPADEVRSVICNPDDSKDPWFYRREWIQIVYNEANGEPKETARAAFYPSWTHNPSLKPPQLYGQPVNWDQPVYHLKVGGLADMAMGVPDVYAAIDWAKAYKEFLEDWCSITRAYARFAWRFETSGGARGVNKVQQTLGTTLASGLNQTSIERNPPPNVASMMIQGPNQKLDPIKTAGATTKADDGRRVLLMVAAAMGLPETFFGDASVGTVATAKSLDRPTELKMLDRQTLWAEVLLAILDFVIDRAAQAPNGPLRGLALVKNLAAGDVPLVSLNSDPISGEAIDRNVEVTFPSLLEHNIVEQITAITTAATLGGYALAGTMDLKTVSRMVLTELGARNVDEILDMMFPEGEVPITGKPMADDERLAAAAAAPAPPKPGELPKPKAGAPPEPGVPVRTAESALMVSAVGELREAIVAFRNKYTNDASAA